MRRRTALLLAATIIASGCAATGPAPEERLEQLSSKASNSTYKVTYSFERPGKSVIKQGLENPTLYSYRGKQMFSTSTSFIGGRSDLRIYEHEEGKSINCVTREMGNKTTKDSCEISNSTTALYTEASRYADKAEDINVAYLGEEEYADRKCSMFGLGIPKEHFRASNSTDSGANVKLCVDNEKGYVAYIQINLTSPVQTASGSIKEIMELKALNYSSTAERADVDPGVGLVASTSCDPLSARVTSLGYSGEFNLSVNGVNSSYSLEEEGLRSFDLSNSSVEGVNEVKAFYRSGVASASCNATSG